MTWDTVNVLIISWAGKIAWKLVGTILNVLEMYRVGKCWVLCPFPCSVLAMYRLGTPPLAPSVRVQVDSTVGQLCQCNKENEEVPSVLDEPIVLHRQGDGPAPIGPSPPLSGLSSASLSSSGLNTLVENREPIPIIYPTLELIQVRRQRARRALGSPTSHYSPYSSNTESRKSPHRLSSQ